MSVSDTLELASPRSTFCDFNNLNAKTKFPTTLREFAIELPEPLTPRRVSHQNEPPFKLLTTSTLLKLAPGPIPRTPLPVGPGAGLRENSYHLVRSGFPDLKLAKRKGSRLNELLNSHCVCGL